MNLRNTSQLEKALLKRLKKATESIQHKALEDMQEETREYYSGTAPVMYRRTYHLMNTPRVSAITSAGNAYSFNAYLDQSYVYPSIQYGSQPPSKTPSMTDVLNLTNYQTSKGSSVGYLHPAIGNSGYWERAKENIRAHAALIMRQYF